MSSNKIYLMHAYLRKYYLSSEQLSENCNLTRIEIEKLQSMHCIPGYSYLIKSDILLPSPLLDSASSSSNVKYFHSSVLYWVNKAVIMHKSKAMSLIEIAAAHQEGFIEEFEKYFGEITTPGCPSLDAAWLSWINGTWGVCLKELSIACMAQKELARKLIAEMFEKDGLSVEERQQLIDAVRSYDESAMGYDPYSYWISSRHTLVERAVSKFNLAISLDSQYK